MRHDLIAKYNRRVPRYTSYPTAPHFRPAVDHVIYRSWLRSLPQGTRCSLYLHVPFCARLCWYCGCHTSVVREHRPIADYVALLEREIDLVVPECRELAAEHIHWGGGTPNMLNGEEIARLMGVLRDRFAAAGTAEVSAELDPRILDERRVRDFAAAGINRASLGVQDFDARVQRAINRIQPFAMTADAVRWLRAAGMRSVNFDLLYGLPHQTVPSVLDTVERAASLAPDRIALFGYAHVPWMKRHQKLLPETALPGPAERAEQCEAAAARLVALGYVPVGLDHFARPDDALAQRLAEGELHRNFQGYTTDEAPVLLGFGVSAIGSLPQGYVQNTADFTLYRERLAAGKLATARGLRLSADDRLRREVIERLMCDMQVDLAAVAARHGRPAEDFVPALTELDELVYDGIARREGWQVAVTDAGRPLVRAVCAVFDEYLGESETRHARAI
jgi:oxygen-independent coproporphyrinogen-3 oxidase